MKVIIMGSGRVGVQLLDCSSTKVTRWPLSIMMSMPLHTWGPNFKGQKIVGVGFDKEVLA